MQRRQGGHFPDFNPIGATGNINITDLANALATGTSVTISTAGGTGGNGDIFLDNSLTATATNNALLTLTGRYLTPSADSTINITNGNLAINLNAVNPSPTPPAGTIQNAINAVGTVTGTTTISLGAGTYTEPVTINKPLTLVGAGTGVTTVSGNNAFRVFDISASNVTLDGLAIANGNAGSDGWGGGIAYSGTGTLNINNSTISGNSAYNGGGILNNYNQSTESGTINLTNTTVTGNHGVNAGGGILSWGTINLNGSTVSNNTTGTEGGAGIMSIWGTLTLNKSTVSGNTATNSIYGGGGIFSYNSNLTVTDSTVSGNSTNTTGGGMYVEGGTATLTNSTIANNSATVSGGGISSTPSAVINIGSTIVAENTAPTSSQIFGHFNDQGNNQIGGTVPTPEPTPTPIPTPEPTPTPHTNTRTDAKHPYQHQNRRQNLPQRQPQPRH
jgi:predicted outer membrane repeat protein